MKAVGRGPITRLANVSATAATGAIYGRDEWNAGRDVSAEERRCGILTRLCSVSPAAAAAAAAATPPRAGTSSLSELAPLEAVARAQTTDAHVTEVDAEGRGAFLEKAPKGRWRKIARARTLLVEDTATPFSDPEKSFSPRVQSYGDYVRRVGRLPEGQPLLRFALFRDGYSLASVRQRLRYELGVPHDAVHLSDPPGGSFAAVTQFGVAVGVTREQLPHASRHYNVHALIFDDRSSHALDELPRLTAAPQAYLHRVLLRCVDGDEAAVSQRLRRLSADGFVNYFGLELFGVGSNTLFDMAAFAHRSAPHHAAGAYLQTLAECNPLHHQLYLSYVNAGSDTAAGVVEQWLRVCERAKVPRETREVLRRLREHHLASDDTQATSMQRVWEACGATRLSEESASAFVWNAMASQRLLTYGARPVKGDLVSLSSRGGGGGGATAVTEIMSDADAARYTIDDVVLPLPCSSSSGGSGAVQRYPTHSVSEALFRAFARQHSLSFLFEAAPSPPSYRPLICRPRQLQAAVLRDPSSCAALKSDLFLLQERQATESWSLDYDRRVREPSPFNVSERFRERMEEVRRHRSGVHSVALSLVLPAGTSPWVALREAFHLHYGTFHDLYGVS
ncbi:tRNA pseudouridine synthase D (TruD) [Novymonas esmeraldas]|uniref:tRNA pseudouridine synthase D (TruD) n=1 Tax=Novymonas esmeraldas TaxID=1808958 RepID=A0AAW0EZG0_9TRYP